MKTVKFYPQNKDFEGIFSEPVPSKKLIPEWYKNQTMYVGGKKEIDTNRGLFNETVKACMPVFDMTTAGYMIVLPADVYVTVVDGIPTFSWSINNFTCIESHPSAQFDMFHVPHGFYEVGFKFINPWIIRTPEGYSSIFMHPTFRDDLPFQCLPAIVDTDKHPIAVNFPFFLKQNFEGLIPAGTPIMQVIPFKRQEWDHTIEEYDESLWKAWRRAEVKMKNRYKTFFRQIKEWG